MYMKTPHVSLGLSSRDFVVQVKMTQDTGSCFTVLAGGRNNLVQITVIYFRPKLAHVNTCNN